MKRQIVSVTALCLTFAPFAAANAYVTTSFQVGQITNYLVTETGIYEIDVAGAQGGDSSGGNWGGHGASVKADFTLSKDDVLKVAVGSAGSAGRTESGFWSATQYGGGGGGGSFVVNAANNPLMIAGGGGGGGNNQAGHGSSKTESPGGGGNGWNSAGAGAGFLGDGGNGGGRDFANGLAGGRANSGYAGGGGFGGGGGGANQVGGGGGGATGGNTGYDYFGSGPTNGGGEGSSYLSSLGTSVSTGLNWNNGFVTIIELSASELSASTTDVPEPITLSLLGTGIAGLGMVRRRRS